MIKLAYVKNEGRVVRIAGAELLAPMVDAATIARSGAEVARGGSETARTGAEAAQAGAAAARTDTLTLRDSAQAAARYFVSQAAGEAGSVAGQFFSAPDGAGGLVYYQRNASGSVEIARVLTPSRLALADGAALVGRKAAGDGAVTRQVSDKLTEMGEFISDRGAKTGQGARAAFLASFAALSTTRTGAAGRVGWGVGWMGIPRGEFSLETKTTLTPGSIGFRLQGTAVYASSLITTISSDAALSVKLFVGAMFSDFSLINRTGAGSSVGFEFDPNGGGGNLSMKRLEVTGYHVCFDVLGTTNADKAIFEQVAFSGDIGWRNLANKQAELWNFVSCNSGSTDTHFEYGGAGILRIASHSADIRGSFLRLLEGAGNPGGAYNPGQIHVSSSKFEYHGTDMRMLIDARAARKATEAGGANVEVVLRDVIYQGGPDGEVPDPKQHVVIQVGEESIGGSDAVVVTQEGGAIEGKVVIASGNAGAVNRRWRFLRARKAPDPATLALVGGGNHPRLIWQGNGNVPLDQERGGQAFTGAGTAECRYECHPFGANDPRLLMTSVGGATFAGATGAIPAGQTRYGQKARLADNVHPGGFPFLFSPTGLGVWIRENAGGADTLIEWSLNDDFTQLIGSRLIPGDRLGFARLRVDNLDNLPVGHGGYLRATKANMNQNVMGAVHLFYFPLMGA